MATGSNRGSGSDPNEVPGVYRLKIDSIDEISVLGSSAIVSNLSVAFLISTVSSGAYCLAACQWSSKSKARSLALISC